jgi:hypothetical protein
MTSRICRRVGLSAKTGLMARTTTDVYHGYDRQDVLIDIPIPYANAGTWHGEIRARILDDESGDWFFSVDWRGPDRETRIDTFPVEWCRRPELDDLAGIVPPAHLERMRREETGDTTADPHVDCPDCDCGMRGPEHCKHAHLAWGVR